VNDAAARARATATVRAVRGDTASRLMLAGAFYDRRELGRYRNAELSFLRWEIARGVLDADDAPVPGSPWWRAINEHLLRDKVEARLLSQGHDGAPSSAEVERWAEFLAQPSPTAWYCAHNSSIVAAYLEHEALAAGESPAERFMINVALVRVLFTHALNARPRLALGALAPLGRVLGDPRRPFVSLFLDLRRSFPDFYPLDGLSVPYLIESEGTIAHAFDYGVITPVLSELYEFAADVLGQPRLRTLHTEGIPCYGSSLHHDAWREAGSPRPWVRTARALTRRPGVSAKLG
jgi:hypothetical protein